MQRVVLFIFALLIVMLPERAVRAEVTSQSRWETSAAGQFRQVNQNNFSKFKSVYEGLLLLALEYTSKYKQWSFEIRPELRALYSPAQEANSRDISKISIIDKTRAMDFHNIFVPSYADQEQREALVSDIEKLNLRYQGTQVEILAGRNPYNPSIMRLSPIWNKFGKDIFYVGYPNLQFNPDISTFKWQQSNFWIQNTNIYGTQPENSANLLILGIHRESTEAQFLTGQWWEQRAYGANLSVSTRESLFKSEVLYIESRTSLSPSHAQGAAGFERSWNNSFSTVSELLVSTLPDQFNDSKQITLGATPFSKLRSKYYFVNQLDYQLTEFWLGSVTPIINLVDHSGVLILSLKGTFSDNLELTASARLGAGDEGNEFSRKSVQFFGGSFVGYNDVTSVMIKYFF